MPYCTLSDLKTLVSETTLLQLTDDNGVGLFVIVAPYNQPYQAILQAIADADTVIDSYLSGRYAVPVAVTPVPPMIRQMSVNFALCNLYDRRRELDLPEGIDARRKRHLQFLKDIKTEVADIPELSGTAQEIAPGAYLVSKTDADITFPDSLLGQM